MSEILKELNEEQKKAVTCIAGPILIVAGAGSGKTRVLTSRIAYLIENGIPPERILSLTFTKKAAGEMKERIGLMIGERKARHIWMGTFHSVFIRFLREFADVIGFPPNFTIYDTADSVSAVKTCIKQLELDDKVYKPKEVLSRISKAKNDLVTPTPYMNGTGGYREDDNHHKKPEIYRIYARYCQLCQSSGVMDFDDILLYMNILLKRSPDALKTISERFSHILVDEYQDTNLAQYFILKKLAADHKNICVVGDDSQSIYGFRGAQIQNILNFRKDFPGASTFRLERNYRSTQTIVNAANTLIAHNEGRIPKNCVSMGEKGELIHLVRSFTEQEEAMQIASAILYRMRTEKARYEDFAILYRTNSQSRALEEQLRRRNIPYMIYSGNSFFERAEVKDLMAYFKLAVNPSDDESFKRVVNKPARGIGDTSLNALQAAALDARTSLFNAASLPDLEKYGLKSAAIGKIRAFTAMMEKAMAEAAEGDAYDVAMTLAQESGLYLFYKADNSVEGQSRFANVEELLNSVKAYVEERNGDYRNSMVEDGAVSDASLIPDADLPRVPLSDYLENVSLLSNVDVADDQINNKVALMTVHTAKGLEFPYVFVSGMEENLFPSGGWMLTPQELEEERRLFYVAITRAERAVSLSFAQTRMRNGKHESNAPSRFLRELAPQYLDHPLRKEDMVAAEDDGPAGFSWRGGASGFGSASRERSSAYGSSRPSSVMPGRSSTVMPGPDRASRPSSVMPGRSSAVMPGSDRASRVPEIERPPIIDQNFIPDPMSSFHVGDRIEHNRFGGGKVLEITGQIPDLKAKISFDRYGEKLLLLKFAKIRHI
ncbi:MAG: UvrD-helicase domain-containing protein [Bacteroidales bacterium]|nr:UvrD-helicase domain-containing protein [Bacteroidales bacterium]